MIILCASNYFSDEIIAGGLEYVFKRQKTIAHSERKNIHITYF